MFFKKRHKLPTIFVQIASYRDPECQWTVKDLFEKAEHPERVFVGICWQFDPKLDQDCFTVSSPRPENTGIIEVLPQDSKGVCWARARSQKMYSKEDYVLMIDSHMRFINGWDTALILEHKKCESAKSFLSSYPPRYEPPDQLAKNPRPVVLRAKQFTENGDIRFHSESLRRNPPKPLKGAFLAAGFLFAPGAFLKEVPYDQYLYFNQEEITLAVRAYTHGWDVYSPSKTFVYHYYRNEQDNKKRATHWADNKDWTNLRDISMARCDYLLTGKKPQENKKKILKDIKKFGLGNERSISEYEEFSGLSFKQKIASEKALKSGFVANIEEYRKPSIYSEEDTLKPTDNQEKAINEAKAGDALPHCQLPEFVSALKECRSQSNTIILCVLPQESPNYTKQFSELYQQKESEFLESHASLVFVFPVSERFVTATNKQDPCKVYIICDENMTIADSLGIKAHIKTIPYSYVLDGEQKIINVYNSKNAYNHIHDLLREAKLRKAYMADAKKIFEGIHTTNMWGSEESCSGPGSTFDCTVILRDRLSFLLSILKVKSILDVPCGDCNFMQHIDMAGIKYIGGDIVEALIKENKEKFEHLSNYKFQVLDALNDPLPETDLIFCRDMIAHFPNEAALKFLKNVKQSKCTYILTTHFIEKYNQKYELNQDIEFGYWRPVSLTKPPFNWPPPLLSIPELEHNKTQSLWRISDL